MTADVKRNILISDFTTFFLCMLFSIWEFALTGAYARSPGGLFSIPIVGIKINRGIAMGVAFLLCAAAVPIVVLILSNKKSIVLGWLRVFFPMAYFGLFFNECIQITNVLYAGNSLDWLFADIDQWLFGVQPAIEFYQIMPESRIITELLFLSYFFFYFLMAGGCWIAYFRNDKHKAADGFAVISTAFYLLYIFYLVFPVKGPKYFFPELQQTWYENFKGFIFTGIMKFVFNNVTLSGAAFPSSHAAISILALIQSYRYDRRIGIIFTPFVVLLLISTVYIYAHYAIDTIAGVLLGIAFYYVMPRVVAGIKRPVDYINMRFWRKIPR